MEHFTSSQSGEYGSKADKTLTVQISFMKAMISYDSVDCIWTMTMIATAFDRLVFTTRQQISQWQLRVTFVFGMLERDRDSALYEQLLIEVRELRQTVSKERADLLEKLQGESQEGAFRASRQSHGILQVAMDNALLRIGEAETALLERIALLQIAPVTSRRRQQARLGIMSPLGF